MDISNLTSQITALRAETQERSISPERVGSLLQQLANLIKSAAESAATQNDIYEITDNALSNIRASVAATANGLSITLTYSELDGEEFPQTVTLPLASSEAAGVLSAGLPTPGSHGKSRQALWFVVCCQLHPAPAEAL